MLAVAFFLVGALLMIAVIFVVAPEKFWTRFAGNPDLGHVDFATLIKHPKPNQYLLCPADLCERQRPDAEPPLYKTNIAGVKAAFLDILGDQEHEMMEDTLTTLRFVMRSPRLRFPDTVSVEFLEKEGGATLAIYSRAQIGYADFDANKERVLAWLKRLSQILPIAEER